MIKIEDENGSIIKVCIMQFDVKIYRYRSGFLFPINCDKNDIVRNMFLY